MKNHRIEELIKKYIEKKENLAIHGFIDEDFQLIEFIIVDSIRQLVRLKKSLKILENESDPSLSSEIANLIGDLERRLVSMYEPFGLERDIEALLEEIKKLYENEILVSQIFPELEIPIETIISELKQEICDHTYI